MTKAQIDNDPEYLERTADRLRAMSAAQVALVDADADEVRARLERMTYGANRRRNDERLPAADTEEASLEKTL